MKSNFKKFVTILLCLTLVLSFGACGKSEEKTDESSSSNTDVTTEAPTEAATEAPTEAPTATTAPTVAPTTAPAESPATSSESVSIDKPYVQYTFDNTLSDATGTGADAVKYGNAAFTKDGPDGKGAITFDGTDGTYVELPKGLFDGMNDLTFSYYAKSNSDSYFFTLGIGLDNNVYLFNRITQKDVHSAITTSTWSGEAAVDYTLDVKGSDWHNYTVVLTSGTMTLYVDGKLASSNDNVPTKVSDMGTGLLTYFGKSFYAEDKYFNGSIADFVVYNGALSAEDVANRLK